MLIQIDACKVIQFTGHMLQGDTKQIWISNIKFIANNKTSLLPQTRKTHLEAYGNGRNMLGHIGSTYQLQNLATNKTSTFGIQS